MLSFLVIQKEGVIRTVQVKSATFSLDQLYKKCGFKTECHFQQQAEWTWDGASSTVIRLYGKSVGKHMMENKYDFPPGLQPCYGACALVAFCVHDSDPHPLSLTEDMWQPIYDQLAKQAVDESNATAADACQVISKKRKTTVSGSKKSKVSIDPDTIEQANASATKPGRKAATSKAGRKTDTSKAGCKTDTSKPANAPADEDIGFELMEEAYTYSSFIK